MNNTLCLLYSESIYINSNYCSFELIKKKKGRRETQNVDAVNVLSKQTVTLNLHFRKDKVTRRKISIQIG